MKRWYCKYCGIPLGIGNIWDCRMVFNDGDCMCINCYQERENMPNIKITAKVNGKQVPLENISTETFKAIKALEKPKEIPMARLVTHRSGSYLLLKQLEEVHLFPNFIHAFDLKRGIYVDNWELKHDEGMIAQYATIELL